MTREELILLIQEAVIAHPNANSLDFRLCELATIEHFAKLVAAAEREACAKTCEEKKSKYDERVSKSEDERNIDPEVARIAKMTCDFNAAAIRARGKA